MRSLITSPLGRVLSPLAGALALGMSTSACDCAGAPPTNTADAARVRLDGGPDAFVFPDTGPYDDADRVSLDVGPVDAYVPSGFDSSVGEALNCTFAHSFGEDIFRLSVDGQIGVPTVTTAVGTSTELVAIYSSTDFVPGSGERNIERFRIGADGSVEPPAIVAGTTGASLPALVSTGSGYWLASVVGSTVRVASYDASFNLVASNDVGTGTLARAPMLVHTSSGGYVAWVSGTTISGRSLDAAGAPTGTLRTLVTESTDVGEAALQRIGGSDAIALAWGLGTASPQVALLGSSGTLGASNDLAGDPGAYTSIDMGGQSATTSMGAALAGAGVYDIEDSSFRDVLFRVVSESATPTFPVAVVATAGEQAWSPSVEPYLSGFALAYRATLPGYPRPVLRIGYLDREGCRLGAVTDRFVIGEIGSETGATPQIAISGDRIMIVWSDSHDTYNEYWAATLTCVERT